MNRDWYKRALISADEFEQVRDEVEEAGLSACDYCPAKALCDALEHVVMTDDDENEVEISCRRLYLAWKWMEDNK